MSHVRIADKNPIKKLPIPLRNRTIFIPLNEIIYITASNYYAEIYTESKKYLLRESLQNLLNILNPEHFIRIHRSTIINIDFMKELINSSYGAIHVKMKDSNQFRISKSYKKEFLTKMGV